MINKFVVNSNKKNFKCNFSLKMNNTEIVLLKL